MWNWYEVMADLLCCTFSLAAGGATIGLMQWLYRHRLVSRPATEQFFRAAKWLERQADWLTTRKTGSN